jgi:CubicO group peptidase (beta-lactamase class C family)
MKIHGHVSSGFEPVEQAFRQNFIDGTEVGASCCVYLHGKPVIDIWAGVADSQTDAPWQEDTISIGFSVTKGITTIGALKLMEQGPLDIDKPIAHYWPEFGCAGKASITTRMVMSHRAGLAGIDGDLTLEQVLAWEPVVSAIAAQKPNWQPNTTHGYHTRSFGWILGEIIRRITGKSAGQYLRESVTAPVDADFWVGLPEAQLSHCARLIPDTFKPAPGVVPSALTVQSFTGPSNLFSYSEMWNDPVILQAEMPSSNGVGNARGLARVYAATFGEVNGVRLLSDDTIAKATTVQSQGKDEIVMIDTSFGLGFMLPPWLMQNNCGPASYGHFGAGGSVGFADPEAGISFGYLMNKMSMDPEDKRAINLVNAVYKALNR